MAAEVKRRQWRVGHHAAPFDPPPWRLAGFSGRYDDADRRFRTLYAAEDGQTALCEMFQDLRTSAGVREELVAMFGADSPAVKSLGTFAWSDWNDRVLVVGMLHRFIRHPLVEVEDLDVRRRLFPKVESILEELEFKYLDIGELNGPERKLTQAVAGHLWDEGAGGIAFDSHINSGRCWAWFEDRAWLEDAGERPFPLREAPGVDAVLNRLGLEAT